MYVDKVAVEMAHRLIAEIAIWKESPQGEKYWLDVRKNLEVLLKLDNQKPPQPQYRTPTDEDAKSRPTVRVRNNNSEEWKEATLIFVDHGGASPNYFTTIKVMSNNETAWTWFRQCQIIDDGGPL